MGFSVPLGKIFSAAVLIFFSAAAGAWSISSYFRLAADVGSVCVAVPLGSGLFWPAVRIFPIIEPVVEILCPSVVILQKL